VAPVPAISSIARRVSFKKAEGRFAARREPKDQPLKSGVSPNFLGTACFA
jgi:hypothetical protein